MMEAASTSEKSVYFYETHSAIFQKAVIFRFNFVSYWFQESG
jgi:hypothetical protein